MAKPKTIEVVYEDGVFKPLEPVDVNEGMRVPGGIHGMWSTRQREVLMVDRPIEKATGR
jgi:predicted DNA-binding antitoxin AbrB/MazE fold protein